MDSDFHYYGTGTAALGAGFGKTDARLIANVAQYVDWFDSDYWSYWRIVDDNGRAVKNRQTRKPYEYEHPQLSVQTIDLKLSFDYNQDIWNPFHFPPGNLPYTVRGHGWKRAFCDRHVVRKTGLSKADANKLCRPFSKFALDMIQDTVQQYQALSAAKGRALEKLVAGLVRPRVRCPVTEGRKLALFLLGIRMHVLGDTWAHQDFTGEPNYDINSAGFFNEVTAQDARGRFQKTEWTGTVWALRDDTDCAAAPPPAPGVDKLCAGHGQMGHYPDYSWLTFKYPAAWLPKGTRFHVRNNPPEYNQAWSWLSFAMGLCNGKMADQDVPEPTPKEIDRVMSTWHKLSTKRPEAVQKSEALWRKTKLGQNLPARWVTTRRAGLGLYDGLAVTRYGCINVKQNSILHLMETAASIHYQFCVDWLAANPKYSWKPWQPET